MRRPVVAIFLLAATAAAAQLLVAGGDRVGPDPTLAGANGAATLRATPAEAAPPPPTNERGAAVPSGIVATHSLGDLPLASVQNAVLPGSIVEDRDLRLGAVGSDLWRSAGDPPGEFWMVTDRGPTAQALVEGKSRSTLLVPGFTPLLLRVRVAGDSLAVLETVPVVGQSGRPVTGLPNLDGADDPVYDPAGQTRLPFDPSGLDPEGIVRTAAGAFWLADEYRPSIVRLDSSGRVVARYVPEGVALAGADYPVVPALPAILSRRRDGGGFEGIGISPDERALYVALQSPLRHPNKASTEASRNTRLLAFDVPTERVVGEYVYRFEPASAYGPKAAPGDVKLRAVVSLSPTTLLLLEGTDNRAKVFSVDLARATNILDTRWDDPRASPSLETADDPDAHGIRALPKALVLDLGHLPGVPRQLEGLAVVSPDTIAVANDNNFDVGQLDAAGRNVGHGRRSQILFVRLPGSLPLAR